MVSEWLKLSPERKTIVFGATIKHCEEMTAKFLDAGVMAAVYTSETTEDERVRLLAAVFDGTLMNYRWCSECCAAMAASWTDNGEAWEARARLGRKSSNV